MNRTLSRVSAGLLVAALSSGCSMFDEKRAYITGLPPTIDADRLRKSTEAQKNIVSDLLVRANLTGGIPANGSADWAVFTEAGFGFVDEQCDRYLDALFWYNRARSATQTQLALTGATAASIMGILDASKEAIAITAAAFGFASGTVDTLASSVLYSLDPSSIKNLVDRSRSQYRQAAASRSIVTQPGAMSVIQGYLRLCLPATIETQINGAVSETGFAEDTTASSGIVPVLKRVGTAQTTSNPTELTDAREPVSPTPPPPAPTRILNPISALEEGISFRRGQDIQRTLCVKADGNFGATTGSQTRTAIRWYQMSRQPGNPEAWTGILDNRNDAITLMSLTPCAKHPLGFKNAFERFHFETADAIRSFQGQLNEALANFQIVRANTPGSFDGNTRHAITLLQRFSGLPETGAVTPALDDILTETD